MVSGLFGATGPGAEAQPEGRKPGVGRGGGQSDIDARVAVAQCQDGNTAAGIPVLQRELRNNKVEVPPP